ncbi:acyl-CoA carboxylase subunit epsilon [Actinomadura sp. KC345]|uniref:acyl-CoA carboxylase epsilon subunit n=1 Tax=Actinomadura sp. KC345 TaxID=2530371 RepID=UPI0010442C75|nr:acyl-CoA carboxylase epsilon subunit [Actinomadura sp. KC345]TDC57490.1 acyl-CoA carboxylase subunit epsilon [Actinomadura sp. KC345]
MTRPDTARPAPLVRIERGDARPEDVAAITAVLLLRARRAAAGRGRDRPAKAAWRSPAFLPPHSWRDGRQAREVRHDTAQGPDRQPR